MRCRNSSVLARSSSSVSFWISGSSALMAWTFGLSDLMTRSFFVPKTLPKRVLIKLEFLQGAARPRVLLKPSTFDADEPRHDARGMYLKYNWRDRCWSRRLHDRSPLLAGRPSYVACPSLCCEGQEENHPAGLRFESQNGSGRR